MKFPVLALALVLTASAARATALTESEKRGRHLYRHGESVSGRPVTAVIGQGETTELAASVLPCGSCHGADGRGVPEGSIEPADIRSATLSHYLVVRSRRRPRYDDPLLARALKEGRDAGDMPLSPVMPRYRMDDRDLADLLAYLRRLGNEPQPGLAGDALTVATVMPLSGPHAATGELTRTVIDGYFADVNAQGGVHGRMLKLRAIDSTRPVDAGDVFAVVCGSFADGPVRTWIDEERVPLVTPLPSGSRTAPSSFSLFSDLESQVLALAKHAGAGARVGGQRNVYILHGDTAVARAAAAALEERASSLEWNVRKTLDPGQKRDDDLLFLIDVDPAAALQRLESMSWKPHVLIAGAPLAGAPSYGGDISLAIPTSPSDLTPDGQHELHAFAERHQLPAGHTATRIAAYSTVKVFVEALKRAGRDLTREKLIATLETFYQFSTGLTPPVTYARNRHIGAAGAFIVGFDGERQAFAETGWVRAD